MTDSFRPHPDIAGHRRLQPHGGRYSTFVRGLKLVLPLVALTLVGILLARLSADPETRDLAAIPASEKTTPGQIELVGAKYEGRDGEGRAYAITAERASRVMNAPDRVAFTRPMADLLLKDGTWVAVSGATGVFDNVAKSLTLQGAVKMYHDAGYSMTADDLQIDLAKKNATTEHPVTAQGPLGALGAQNMTVEEGGNRIIFGGPASLTLFGLGKRG